MAPSSRLPRFFSWFAAFLLLTQSHSASGQESADKTTGQSQAATSVAPAKTVAKDKAAAAAAKAKIEQQKAVGLSLLVSLANDARNFSDQKLRARTLSRIADALWDADPEQGRALFRKAWDSAESADQDSARRFEEESRRQQAPFARAAIPDVRAEVLRLAAKHDRALGEELLDKLKEAKKQEAADATSPNRNDSLDTPAAIKQRLRLANQLLEVDVERALQFADPVLNSVTMEGIDFLSLLRDKNALAADERYARMLAFADADLKSDANIISLLSSYLFTPHLFVTFEPDGGQSSSSMNRRTPPPNVAPELRNSFFRTATRILLRPSPSSEQDRSSSGLQGKYMLIRRMMPLFEQYLAKETADQLRNEVAVLGQATGRTGRETPDDGDDYPIQRGITPDRKPEDIEKGILDRLDRAKTSEERDLLYIELATRSGQRGDLRARDFADKVEDSELRKQVRPYIDMVLAQNAVEKKDAETALLLAGKGEFSHIQRVWLLTQAAKVLPDRERALETIADAAAEARRIDGSDPDRTRALIAVANAFMPLDRTRAWETMLEVAKASNSVEGFNGEDGRIGTKLQTKNMSSMHSSTVEDFNLPGIFRALAQENASQAIELARSFEGEAPRSTALIAVGRSLLSDKK